MSQLNLNEFELMVEAIPQPLKRKLRELRDTDSFADEHIRRSNRVFVRGYIAALEDAKLIDAVVSGYWREAIKRIEDAGDIRQLMIDHGL